MPRTFTTVADWKRLFLRMVLGKDPVTLERIEPEPELFAKKVSTIEKYGILWESAFGAALELAEHGAHAFRHCVKLVRYFFEPLSPLSMRARRTLSALVFDDKLPRRVRNRAELALFVVKQGVRVPWEGFVASTNYQRMRDKHPAAMAEVALLHGQAHTAFGLLHVALGNNMLTKKELMARYERWAKHTVLNHNEMKLPFLSAVERLILPRNKAILLQ